MFIGKTKRKKKKEEKGRENYPQSCYCFTDFYNTWSRRTVENKHLQ